MATIFSSDWAEAAAEAINTFPDDTYRETKLFMFWDWIAAARAGFNGSLCVGVHDLPNGSAPSPSYATFTFTDGQVTSTTVGPQAPADATFVLGGNYETWKDIVGGYDAGKAVMYRRLRLEQGDVFRFFNRVYLFTESLVALSKVPATLPA